MSIHIFLSGIATVFFLVLLLPFLRRKRMDQISLRSSHTIPTPRGGGLAFVVVSSVSLVFVEDSRFAAMVCAALPLALLGWIDDRRSCSVRLRLVIQGITVVMLLLLAPLSLSWWHYLAITPVLIALVNFMNFMDGLDGLLASCMSVVSVAAALVLNQPSLFILTASLIAFLAFNWSPAQVFMGDVGSIYLGTMLSIFLMQSDQLIGPLSILLIAMPLWLDAGVCVLRRWIAGQVITKPHRLHLYQRLQQAGWSHRSVSLSYSISCTVQIITYLIGGLALLACSSVLLLVIGLILDRSVAVPFSTSSSL